MRSATVVLPVPGLPVKDICSVGVSAVSPSCSPHPFDHQQRGDFADARLDRLQADQLAIELVENLLDARAFEFGAQIGRRGR